MLPLFPSFNSHFSQVAISMLLFLLLLCCISSLGKRAYGRGSSNLRSTLMAGATTILVEYLPTTSMGGLCLPTAHSPVMGGITFLLGTSPPLSTGVVHFPLALVSFPVRLHWLPRAAFFGLIAALFFGAQGTPILLGFGCHQIFSRPWAQTFFSPSIPSSPFDLPHPSSSTTKVLKLEPIKDTKAYLDVLGIIEFYLCKPEFSTNHADGKLIMTASNLKVSCLWEG
jgi:hypothetical protein